MDFMKKAGISRETFEKAKKAASKALNELPPMEMPDILKQGNSVGVYKVYRDAQMPVYGTQGSACFDLHACLINGMNVTFYDEKNEKRVFEVRVDGNVLINPGERFLVPSGLIFDLPDGHSMRVHPRSSVAIKRGLPIVNCEGVVDSDYVEETFITLFNVSEVPVLVSHGERVAQAEIVKDNVWSFFEEENKPEKKLDRDGGIGSTGV